MSIFRALKSLVSPQAMAEEVVDAQYKSYMNASLQYPNAEPHELLAMTLTARWAAKGVHITPDNSELIYGQALTETMQFACLPPPSCIRAFGLYLLHKEQPAVIGLCPNYGVEFEVLMRPVRQSQDDGTFLNLYTKVNPLLAAAMREEA